MSTEAMQTQRKKLKQLRPVAFLLRHRIWSSILAVVLVMAIVWTVLAQFASWSLMQLINNIGAENPRIWVITDKQQVNAVDTITMEKDGFAIEVIDPTLKKDLIRHADYSETFYFDSCHECYPPEKFYLYHNGQVIRTLFVPVALDQPSTLYLGKQESLRDEGTLLGYVTLSRKAHQPLLDLIEQHEKELLEQTVRDVDAILRVRGAGVYGEVQEVLKGTCDYEQIRLTNHTFEDHEEYIILVNQRHNTLYELPQLPKESRMQEVFVLSIDKQAEIEQLIDAVKGAADI